jgi:S1/P1 Nuclease
VKTTLVSILILTVWVPIALAWSPEGHQTVAELARTMLTPQADAQIKQILGNDDLAAVATWSDEIRAAARGKGPLVHDQEAKNFNIAHPHNDQWHFVNLPLGTTNYTDNGLFSATNDVVHTINRCIAVLENKSKEMTKSQALRVLVHMTGDIHQPLHVGTGYFNVDDNGNVELIKDPAQAAGKPDDVGGNDLFYGPGAYDELHGYWDGYLVEKIDATTTYHKLAPYLSNKVDKVAWKTPGDYHKWAEKWATDSVKQALAAYQGIQFSQAVFNTHQVLKKLSITLPAGYETAETDVAAQQICKAGFHLADLLNHIQWSSSAAPHNNP